MSNFNGKPHKTDEADRLSMVQEALADLQKQEGQQLAKHNQNRGLFSGVMAADQLAILQQQTQNQLALNQMDNQQVQLLALQLQGLAKDVLINDFNDGIDGGVEIDITLKGRCNK